MLAAVEDAKFGIGDYGVKGPDPAVSFFPNGIVDIGDEVLNAVCLTSGPSLNRGSAVEERRNVGEHRGTAGGVASCARTATRGVEQDGDLMVYIFYLDTHKKRSWVERSELHD